MNDIIIDLFDNLELGVWAYIAMALVGVVFIICAIALFASGDVNKFKKAAKVYTQNPTADNLEQAILRMPQRIKALFNRMRKTGENATDAISLDCAITAPYSVSAAPKMPFIVCIVSLFSFIFSTAASYFTSADILTGYSLATVIVGFALTIIMLVLSQAFNSGACKAYYNFVNLVDNPNYQSELAAQDATAQQAQMAAQTQQIPQEEDGDVISDEELAAKARALAEAQSQFAQGNFEPKEIPQFGVVNNNSYHNQNNHNNQNPTPVDNDFMPMSTVPVASGVESTGFAKEQSAAPFDTNISNPEPNIMGTTVVINTEPPKARPAAHARPSYAATRGAAPSPRPSVAPKPTTSATKPAELARAANSAEELLNRINRAIEANAPLDTLKLLTRQLQSERAKPENKITEKQKRLSEAQIKLMKAMTGAMKK